MFVIFRFIFPEFGNLRELSTYQEQGSWCGLIANVSDIFFRGVMHYSA